MDWVCWTLRNYRWHHTDQWNFDSNGQYKL
jgi:hypothetical protein